MTWQSREPFSTPPLSKPLPAGTSPCRFLAFKPGVRGFPPKESLREDSSTGDREWHKQRYPKSWRGNFQKYSTVPAQCQHSLGVVHTCCERKAQFGQFNDTPFVKTLGLASCHTFKTKSIQLFHKFKANLVMAKLQCKDLNMKKNDSLEVTVSNTHATRTKSSVDEDRLVIKVTK